MISFKNMRQFELDLDGFAKRMGMLKSTVYRRATAEIWNDVTGRTPVATGRARSSWNIATGSPDPSWPDEGYGESGVTVYFDPPSLPASLKDVDGTKVVWITSNLPYIEPLEHGHSKQAPTGMVMISVANFMAKVQLWNEQTFTQ